MHTLNQCFSIHKDERLSSGKAKDGAPWEETEGKHCSFQRGLSETKAVERHKGEVAESSIQRHHEALLRIEPLN